MIPKANILNLETDKKPEPIFLVDDKYATDCLIKAMESYLNSMPIVHHEYYKAFIEKLEMEKAESETQSLSNSH